MKKNNIIKKLLLCILIIIIFFCIFIFSYDYFLFRKIKRVNITIDDSFGYLYQLNEKKYNSIFEYENFKYLKELHDKFDSKFTLFVFFEYDSKYLSDCTSYYKKEFEDNSDWLNFGFHSYSPNSNYSLKNTNIIEEYNKTINALKKIVGEKSITKVIRLEKYMLSESNLKLLNLDKKNIEGLLSAETKNRKNYYLNDYQNDVLFKNDYYYDYNNNIEIYKTDFRLENSNYFFDNNQIGKDDFLVIFTHEGQLNRRMMKMKLYFLCFKLKNKHFIIL